MILLAFDSLITKPDSPSLWIFAVAVAGILLLIFIGALLNRRAQLRNPSNERAYGMYLFRRMARNIGLPKPHFHALSHLVRVCKVKQPPLLFTNPGLLDDVLKKGIYSVEAAQNMSNEEKDRRIALYFQVKQIVERGVKRGVGIKSTHMVKPGQDLLIRPESGGEFLSRVVSNMRDMLACSAPMTSMGTELRWQRGVKVTVSFWREGDAGYAFDSKVLGYDSVKGVPSILIQHSKTLGREQRRKFRRKAVEKACFFYPITVVEREENKKLVRKAIVEGNQRFLGTVLDLSGGGCSIRTLKPLVKGKLIMVEFEMERRNSIKAFGKVRHIKVEKNGGTMHVMFTGVTSKYLNQIYRYVYDYTMPQSAAIPAGARQQAVAR